ncbi:hypothetical protein [Microbacterium sp. MMO-10]|uniref:hypothetical protein n=1 Tax=Microbacterium sp. MMO-10 TaxID=3081272 RepID=UPI003016D1BB
MEEREPGLKRVRLTGARFEAGRLPVDSLAELQKYQQVVRIAAEAEWLQAHPGEQLPDDFSESVSLTIERIDKGSADVFLAFEQHQVYVEYQVEAQDAADAIIVAAYSDAPIPDLPSLTTKQDVEFREVVASIGSTLVEGQSIEFYPDGTDSSPVSITIETHKDAVVRLSGIEDFLVEPAPSEQKPGLEVAEESLVGRVTALDADRMRFTLTLADGEEVHGFYKNLPGLLEDFRKLVNSTAEGPLTRITGDLQTRGTKLFRFWETSSVEQVEFDDTAWGARLREFTALRAGWDGGSALQISATALDAAQKLLQGVDRAQLQAPGVFPTDEGGVLIEWSSPAGIRSIEILADGGFELFVLLQGQQSGEHSETNDVAKAIAFAEAIRA